MDGLLYHRMEVITVEMVALFTFCPLVVLWVSGSEWRMCVCLERTSQSKMRWGAVFFKWNILTFVSGVCQWWKSASTQVNRDISSWATDHHVIPIYNTRPKSEPRNFFTSMWWLGRIYVNLTDYEIPVKDEGIKSGHCFQGDCENLVLHSISPDHSYHNEMTVFFQWNLSSVTENICIPLSSSTCTSCSWLENLHKSFLFVVVL